MDSALPGLMCLATIAIVFVLPMWAYTLVTERTLRVLRANAIEAGRNEPVTIQPFVDLSVCMGSGACVPACPEDVLKVIERQAVAVNMSACIGHGACVAACPVGAIELVFGSNKRGIDIPQVGPDFQTNVPGVFVAGELGGMGLIANATEQGQKAAQNALTGVRSAAGSVDVAIIGAGPAGIAAAAFAKARGASYVLLDQDALGGAVRHYPRKKLVFTRPMEVPGYPKISLKTLRKEELVSLFEDIVGKLGLEVSDHERVDKIERRSGGFALTTTKRTVEAQRVILALGRRGTPRKLGCSGEELEKVAYSLLEPEQFQYEHIIVVGGGDSAIEAATVLADQPGNRVTLSYRGEKINRPKEKNIQILRDAMKAGLVDVLLESEIKEITKDRVVLAQRGEEVILPNDAVFVLVGGVLPTKFLKSVGITIERHFGQRIELADDREDKPREKKAEGKGDAKPAPKPKPNPKISGDADTSLVPILPALGPGGHDEPTIQLPDAEVAAALDDAPARPLGAGIPVGAGMDVPLEPISLDGDSGEATVTLDGDPDAEMLALVTRIDELCTLADSLVAQDAEAAEQMLGDALRDALRAELAVPAAAVWHGLARCAEARGLVGEARARLGEGLTALTGGGPDVDAVRIPLALDAVRFDTAFGRYGEALAHLDAVAHRVDGVDAVRVLFQRAAVHLGIGQRAAANQAVDEGLAVWESLPGTPSATYALLGARALLDLGRTADAAALLTKPGDTAASPIDDPVGQLLALRARVSAADEPAVARSLAGAALARPAPASVLAAARLALDCALALVAAGIEADGRTAAKRALKVLKGTGVRGMQVDTLSLIVGLGADPAVGRSLASTAAAILADLPPDAADTFRMRFGMSLPDGHFSDLPTGELAP